MVAVPTTLTFRHTHNYADQSGSGITIPIGLSVGAKSVRLLAKLDTGASNCIFQREYGEQLGLVLEDGEYRTFQTATSTFETYGHNVTISSFEWHFDSIVYFSRDRAFSRNVLGRNGWLQQFRLALVDYDSLLHLSHYNQL